MLNNIIISFLFIGLLVFLYFWRERRDRAEQDRFREFVIATKSNNIVEYKDSIPVPDKEIIEEARDEYVELSEVDHSILLKR